MKKSLLRLISILILASLVLTPRQGLGAGTEEQQSGPDALTLGNIRRVSLDSNGIQVYGDSGWPSISADGRYVAFHSKASYLADGDANNGENDVFVHDLQTGRTERVSVTSEGTGGDGWSCCPSISADGRYVAFKSVANLLPGETNWLDVFVHDRQTGKPERVSVSSDGNQGSGGGSKYGFSSISADGRFVAFDSEANNLVEGDTDNFVDVFVHDRQTGITEMVSVTNDGDHVWGVSSRPSISADGRYVAFHSNSHLVSGDINGAEDIFVRDRLNSSTERVSIASWGEEGNGRSLIPSISADGRFVAFESFARDLVIGDTNKFCDLVYDGLPDDNCPDVFIHDRAIRTTERVSVASDGTEGNSDSFNSSISSDGRYVAFESRATNLAMGVNNVHPHLFLRDTQAGTTTLLSLSTCTNEIFVQGSAHLSISNDGRYVAFSSCRANIVIGDNNGSEDVFVYDRGERLDGYRIFLPVSQNQP